MIEYVADLDRKHIVAVRVDVAEVFRGERIDAEWVLVVRNLRDRDRVPVNPHAVDVVRHAPVIDRIAKDRRGYGEQGQGEGDAKECGFRA